MFFIIFKTRQLNSGLACASRAWICSQVQRPRREPLPGYVKKKKKQDLLASGLAADFRGSPGKAPPECAQGSFPSYTFFFQKAFRWPLPKQRPLTLGEVAGFVSGPKQSVGGAPADFARCGNKWADGGEGAQAQVGGACSLQTPGPSPTPAGVASVVAPALEPGKRGRSQPPPAASECGRGRFRLAFGKVCLLLTGSTRRILTPGL